MTLHTQWQYKVVPLKPGAFGSLRPEDLEEALDKLGSQGWELTHVHQPAVNLVWLYLKKPK